MTELLSCMRGVRVRQGLPWAVGTAAERLAGRASSSVGELLGQRWHDGGGDSLHKPCAAIWVGGDLRQPAGFDVDVEGYVLLCPGLAIGRVGGMGHGGPRHAGISNDATGGRSLADIVRGYDPDAHPLVRVLVKDGPLGLANLADRRGYRLPAYPVSRCHL